MSDTPETDKVEQYVQRDINRKWVLSDFAKRIERERDELKEKIKSLTSPAIECVLTRMRGNLEIVDRIKIERDELRAEVEQLKSERENWRVSSVCRELQSQIQGIKALSGEQNRCMNQLRQLWKHIPSVENKYDERLAYHLNKLIETLKADNERLDWLEKQVRGSGYATLIETGVDDTPARQHHTKITTLYGSGLERRYQSPQGGITLRAAIDVAMKGDK